MTEVEPRLSYVIGRLERALRRRLDEGIRAHDLTTLQYTTLSVLRVRGGLSNARLARRSFVSPQAMSELLKGLEGKGLIRREPDPGHGRIRRVDLTPAGNRVLSTCDRVVDEIEREMLVDLDPRERERLMASLVSCVRVLGAGF